MCRGIRDTILASLHFYCSLSPSICGSFILWISLGMKKKLLAPIEAEVLFLCCANIGLRNDTSQMWHTEFIQHNAMLIAIHQQVIPKASTSVHTLPEVGSGGPCSAFYGGEWCLSGRGSQVGKTSMRLTCGNE